MLNFHRLILYIVLENNVLFAFYENTWKELDTTYGSFVNKLLLVTY